MNNHHGERQLSATEHQSEPVRWLRFLPRWSLALALAALTLPLLFLGGLGQHPSDNALGPAYVELLQAIRNPLMFSAVWAIDALIWLMLGGSLLVFAGFLRRHTPVKATFIGVCGVAQLFGAMGSFLRLDGISDLATHYVIASSDQQAIILEMFLNLGRVTNATNHIGVLLQGVGYLLTTVSVFSLGGFPRWLAAWLALPSLLGIAQFALFLIGAQYLFALNIIGLIGGNIALNLALASALWRPPSELVSTLSDIKDTGKN
jgi:hypothetical protein